MNSVKINNRTYQVPSSYNDLTAKKLRRIVQVHLSRIDPQRAKILLLKILIWKNNWWFRRLPDTAISDMLLLTDWLFDPTKKDLYKYRAPNLIKQILPVFKHRFRKYYGPSMGLGNITTDEWARAEEAYLKFLESKDILHLDTLIAILYRPASKKPTPEDIREEFNDYTYQARAKNIRTLGLFTKFSILYFYEGCRTLAVFENKNYSHVFKSKEVSSHKPDKNKTWVNFIVDLAGPKWGDEEIKRIGGSKLHTILYQLNHILSQKK